jgi:hypothetical protein
MAERPFRIGGPANPAGIVRRSDGRFARDEDATIAPDPANTSAEQPQPQRVRPNWVPGIDQNGAAIRKQSIPTPPAARPAPPFKFGG